MKVQRLLIVYHKLPEEQKAIMRLKALLYFKAPVESVRHCFSNLTYLLPVKKIIITQQFNSHIETLKRLKLVNREGLVPQVLIHSLTVDALNSEYAKDYLESMQVTSTRMGHRLYSGFFNQEKSLNDLRLALYMNQEKDFLKALESYSVDQYVELFKKFFLNEFLGIDWLNTRPLVAQQVILYIKLLHFCLTGSQADQIASLLAYYQPLRVSKEFASFDQTFLLFDILSGDMGRAKQTLERLGSGFLFAERFQGIISFMTQNNEQSITFFEGALKSLKRATRKKKIFLGTQESLFYSLALLHSRNRQNYKKLEALFNDIFQQLEYIIIGGDLRHLNLYKKSSGAFKDLNQRSAQTL